MSSSHPAGPGPRDPTICSPADQPVLDHLVLLANELATNVIAHGGGRGRLLLWVASDRVYCQVSDHGPGLSPDIAAGPSQPPLGATSGRGLWLVRTLADELALHSDATGTTITAVLHRADPIVQP